MAEATPQKILRSEQVFAPNGRTGVPKSTAYAWIAAGLFPPPVTLNASANARSVGWLEAEIDEWIESRVAARNVRAEQEGLVPA